MAKSKKPDKLAISRNGTSFKLSWSLPKGGYESQKMSYRWYINGKAQGWVKGWADNKAKSHKTTKSVSVSYNAGSYYPSTSNRITGIELAVGGTAKNKKWSGWAYFSKSITPPNIPSITQTVNTEVQAKCAFTATTSYSNTDYKPYYNGLFQTILVKDSDEESGAKAWELGDAIIESGGLAAGASYTWDKQEDGLELSSGSSYVRWVRMQSRGAGGWSSWAYQHHSYALPNRAVVTEKSAQEESAGGYTCYFEWEAQPTFSRPIDRVVPQYCFATPEEGMECPDGVQWESLPPVILTANKIKDETGEEKTIYKDATRFSIDRSVGRDQCLFVRANTEHDKIGENYGVTRGEAVVAATGYLKDPGTPTYVVGDNYTLTVTAENKSDVDGSIVAVYYSDSDHPSFIAGYIENGQTTANVKCPAFAANPKIGVKALVPSTTPVYTTDSESVRHYTIDAAMESLNMVYSAGGGIIPTPPTNVEVVQSSETANTIRVSWSWTWDDATGVELSWADHADAWESTDEPETYDVSAIRASAWNISGLEAGVTWYVRVRFIKEVSDSVIYSPYSVIKSVTPKSSPSIPSLDLSSNVITPDGSVTASWGYTTTDGTGQGYAEITTAVINAAGIFYGKYALTEDTEVVEGKVYFDLVDDEYVPVTPETGDNPFVEGWYEVVQNIIAHTETAQHVTINADDPATGWQAGETYLLCVRVMSQSGARSEGWSAPQSITIAEPLVCTITNTSLTEGTITSIDEQEETVTETVAALDEFSDAEPLTVTVSGAGSYGRTVVAIERADDFVIERPDGTTYHGYAGETVALIEQAGDSQITIDTNALIGTLDDTGVYRIVATVMDELGQTDTSDKFVVNGNTYDKFSVLWSHQAITPTATAVIDTTDNISKITPVAPTGTLTGDTCDIYRLSVDKAELVVKGGEFGTTYVDPYPTIGEYGGHRVVFMTYNGDYYTEDAEPAWVDTDDILDLDYSIIDFDGDELEVAYNMELSSSFEKSFEETTYLGGAVKGDWNASVSRKGSIKAACVVNNDPETIEKVRALATYAGICHVRSKDGSSYAADVQVSDEQSYDTAGKVYEFTLSITKVDTEGADGMTLSEWEAQQE